MGDSRNYPEPSGQTPKMTNLNYSERTEQIREYQDMVVTLRQDASLLYKGLLMKECQVVSNNMVRSD